MDKLTVTGVNLALNGRLIIVEVRARFRGPDRLRFVLNQVSQEEVSLPAVRSRCPHNFSSLHLHPTLYQDMWRKSGNKQSDPLLE